MARRKATSTGTGIEVDAIRHTGDTRVNIPTEELRDWVGIDESAPTTMLYPRDPSLDPQLVWKGKDEQDRADLAVPVAPIYIQEKIHPRALIDDLRARGQSRTMGQLDLFADFDGEEVDFERQVEFYQHERQWSNRMILGDSLTVMASLAEKEGLKGKVQTIYLDPPYGIRFNSNWQVSTRKRDVRDGTAGDATRQPEQVKAFRDTWKLGIHSYLAYLRDRFVVARDLLTDSGSIFVQIGDENVHRVRAVMDEVFGDNNFVAQISFQKTTGQSSSFISSVLDVILWYARDKSHAKYRQLVAPKVAGQAGASEYNRLQLANGSSRRARPEEVSGELPLPEGARLYSTYSLFSAGASKSGPNQFEFHYDGKVIRVPCPPGYHFKTNEPGLRRLALADRLVPRSGQRIYKQFLDDRPFTEYTNAWLDSRGEVGMVYVVQTATRIVERCLLMTTDPGDLVLDPTCGSGTTAYVAEQWGRRWITVDTSRVALALARTRLMAGRYPYYLLADTPEGQRREAELTGLPAMGDTTGGDVRKGFVYRRVPHITLGSIANNPDIREGMSREKIDAAIARHADTETLYDQPYEDKGRVRVSGPFTVESLSPHRVLSTDEHMLPDDGLSADEIARQDGYSDMVLGYLGTTPVQNTVRDERMKLENIQPYASQWIQATGEYTDAEGTVRRVAVSLGPETGTVGPRQVKEAAKEAVRGLGFDVLLVCGFAFDPHVTQEVRSIGQLTILPVRMNADMMMGDELLKKTGAGNLFLVFGEPDIDLIRQDDGRLVVSIKGVDVYDPTTATVRSDSPDEIACWFIDTAYNEESFFVRHAYFTGAQDAYARLKRALKAEIDEDAWASLHSTESRPFERPESGKIAVKVINHYGDEVMKVFEV